MSSLDRIRQAFPELSDASDSEVLAEASRRTGMSQASIADTFGIQQRSFVSELGRQAAAGLVVDAPSMIGQALKYYSEPGGQRVEDTPFQHLNARPSALERDYYGAQTTETAPAYSFGQGLVRSARARAPEWEADMRGRGAVAQGFLGGARAIGAMAPTLATMAVPGGAALAPIVQAAYFGGSSAQDTYEKLLEQGISEEDAAAAARRVWGIQGVGEGIATAGLGAALRPALAAARGLTTTAGVAQAVTDTGFLRPLAKGIATNTLLQAGTEAGQDVGTSLTERAYGATPEDLGQIASQSAMAGGAMALLLGPLSIGGHAARSRRTAALKNALYGENATPEDRAMAMDAVAQEARRQGVGEKDISEWTARQLREADATNAYLAAHEQALADDIQSASEQEPLFADIAYALRDPELSAVMSDEDRSSLFAAAETLRSGTLDPMAARSTIEQANNIIAAYMAGDVAGTEQDLMARDGTPALFRAPSVTQTPVGGLTQVSTNFPVDLTAYEAPTGLGREVARTQPVAGVEGVRQIAPGIFTAPEQLQQVETRQAPVAPAPAPTVAAPAPVAAKPTRKKNISSGVPAAAASPSAPVAEGISSTQENVSQATETVKAEAQGQKPAAAADVADVADVTPEDEQVAQKAIDDLGLRPLAGGGQTNLQASVRGGNIAVSGKTTIGAKALAAARNAFLGARTNSEEGGKLAAAAKAFGDAYMKYLNAAGNMVPTESRVTLKPTKTFPMRGDEAQAEARAGANVEKTQTLLRNTQSALSALGEAAGNNAKNVEALIRVVKNEIGRRKAELQKQVDASLEQDGDSETTQGFVDEIAQLEKLDQGLSAGWAAAKRGVFRLDADVMDVRGGEIRTSMEEKTEGATQPLERAATYGAAVGPRAKAETGFQGVLNYIRSKGTPFERLLAKAVSEVFKNTKNPPQLEFTTDGRTEYDPNTNTVYMSKTASPEVALHEGLHAALQWFIHNNPKNPVVQQLLKAVDKVVKYDTSKLSEKAAAVQKVLADLKAANRPLDAALELVSYGNTLVEFRKALEAMPTRGTPVSFVQAAKDVWNMILATVRRMLNVPKSVASDVIMDSFKLLEEASRTEYKAASGETLKAAVTSDTKYSPKESPQLAMEKYAEGPGWALNFTRTAFEGLGFGEEGARTKAINKKLEALSVRIAKDFPTLAKNLRNIASTFGLTGDYKALRAVFKQGKQTGMIEAEAVLKSMYNNPADALRVLQYLNGDKSAIKDSGKDAVLRDQADAIDEHFKAYIAALPEADRRMFEGLKFTDMLLKPERLADLAKKSFGMHSVQAIFKSETRQEVSIDEFKSLLPMQDDVVDQDAPLYQLFHTTADGKRLPYGFIAVGKASAHPELDIDRSRRWYADGMKNGEYNFKTRNLSGKNLLDVASRLSDPKVSEKEKEDATQQISSALMTTMAALSHNTATQDFFGGLQAAGRTEDGKATEQTLVFDSVDEINELYPENKQTEDSLIQASDDESKIDQIRKLAQREGVWVRLPDTAHYGNMAGKIISGGVWSDMLDMHDRQPLIKSALINEMLTAFKKNKTVFSPATHTNNILTNYALMLLHGISHKALGDAATMIAKYELNPGALTEQQRAIMKAFYKNGAVLGQFTNAETKSYIAKRMEQRITQQNDRSVLDKLLAWGKFEQDFADHAYALKRKGAKIDSVFSDAYAAGDNVFRLAAFLKVAGTLQAKNNGKMSDSILGKAGLAARQMFLDYDIDSRWVRAARQSALPFISWSYAMLPMLGRLAVTRPWAMVNMMAALYAMGAMGGDDEWRKKGPDAVRERSLWGMGPYNMIRLPFVGTDENPVYWNIGKSIPMMSIFEPPQGNNKLFNSSWFPGFLTPSGPYITLTANLLFNTDPFTGKAITTEADTGFDKFGKYSAAVWDTFAPSPVASHFWKDAKKDWTDTRGPTGRGMDHLYMARLFGLTAYEYDATEARFYQDAEVKAIKREYQDAINKAKRAELQKGVPDYEALDAEVVDLRERLQKRIAEIRGEE